MAFLRSDGSSGHEWRIFDFIRDVRNSLNGQVSAIYACRPLPGKTPHITVSPGARGGGRSSSIGRRHTAELDGAVRGTRNIDGFGENVRSAKMRRGRQVAVSAVAIRSSLNVDQSVAGPTS